ncbi:class I SAM-dependent methyltransferase [Virgibacillus flavescens]|uniref:class I SAM-dependent methyltransferase n=1 Tax=Virgibacillus flavescens TaxID=1611422 RepID=UPI003D352D19
MDYTKVNSETWDKWSKEKFIWTVPLTAEQFAMAKKGEWDIFLTPNKPVPKDWIGELENKRVLGLASGGGQQGPILSSQGAKVTILDYSKSQLEADRSVSEREGYRINLVHADMTKELPFEDESFDLIIHPVSNCYVQDIHHVWSEAHRILKKDGLLISGFTNPILYALEEEQGRDYISRKLPVDPLNDLTEEELQVQMKEEGIQFSHSLDSQIGGQCLAGFKIEGLYEDKANKDDEIPLFISTKARK